MKAFLVDVALCNGCYCCQIACKDEHAGNDWMPYSKEQPDVGQFWLKLNEYIQGTVPKVKMHYIPVMCAHCSDAPCEKSCPVEGAIYRRKDALVIIDPAKCTGCRNCVDACPYGAIYFNEGLNLAQKCTGCAHLLDSEGVQPRCVDVCPTGALKFGEESEFKSSISRAEVLKPDAKTGSRVYYLNIPRKFIAATVIDPVEKEVVAGARCTLTDKESGRRFTTLSDGFGDFWFENLDEGQFSLVVEKEGKNWKIDSIKATKSVNLGTIQLT